MCLHIAYFQNVTSRNQTAAKQPPQPLWLLKLVDLASWTHNSQGSDSLDKFHCSLKEIQPTAPNNYCVDHHEHKIIKYSMIPRRCEVLFPQTENLL